MGWDMEQDQGFAATPPGLRPSGAEPATQSQAKPLVPNALEDALFALDDILSDEHDRHMFDAGFVRGPNGRWVKRRVSEEEFDHCAAAKANAVYNARYKVRQWFAQAIGGPPQ